MWNRKFPMLIASRGFGKSFMLSLYALLRALLLPKRKVVVVGAALVAGVESEFAKKEKIKPRWVFASLTAEAVVIFAAMTIPTGLLF